MVANSEQVIIVGGGIAGLSAAASLASAGLPVILLEANKLGASATSRNQGWLHSGALFAADDIELARQCLKAMQQTISFCPRCVETSPQSSPLHHGLEKTHENHSAGRAPLLEGMLFLTTHTETLLGRWTHAWNEVGIPHEEIGSERFAELVPEADPAKVKRALLLPDRAFRPDILLDELASMARNAGAEIRVESPVTELIVEDDIARGVVTGKGETIGAAQVVLSTGALTERELAATHLSLVPGQPAEQRVALKTHLVSVRPDLSQVPFVFLDWHELNHVPHMQTSVFHSGTWKPTADPRDTKADPQELKKLWGEIESLFPEFDRSSATEVHEWAGTTVQAMGLDQIAPGKAPRPAVIDHGDEGGPQNLWSIYPGRATLWPHLAEELRTRLLPRVHRQPVDIKAPPWAI